MEYLCAQHLIEQRQSQGKGLGIFSTQNIPRGTRIIAELGLLKINDNQDKPSACPDIIYAFEISLIHSRSHT